MKKQSITNWLFTLLVCFIVLWPVYWIVKSSFTCATMLYQTPIQYLPVNLVTDSYRVLFGAANMPQFIGNTLVITFATIMFSVLFCALAGYAFARNSTKSLNIAFAFLLFHRFSRHTATPN